MMEELKRVDHDQRSHVLLAEFDGDSVLLNTPRATT